MVTKSQKESLIGLSDRQKISFFSNIAKIHNEEYTKAHKSAFAMKNLSLGDTVPPQDAYNVDTAGDYQSTRPELYLLYSILLYSKAVPLPKMTHLRGLGLTCRASPSPPWPTRNAHRPK